MFDIGMTELLLIGIVALIVVGPKDLPGLFRTLGRFTAKARALGQEFTRAMNDAADQSGMKEAADGLKAVGNPKKYGLDKLKETADSFEKWDPTKPSGKAGKDEAKPVDPDRADDTRKIREATRKAGEAKLEKERAAKAAETGEAAAAPAKSPAKSPAKTSSKAPAKSPAAKSAAKSPAAKKPAAKSTASKPAASKTSASKTTAKTSKAKAPAKTPAKSTAKPVAPKTAAKTTKTPKTTPATSAAPRSSAKKAASE